MMYPAVLIDRDGSIRHVASVGRELTWRAPFFVSSGAVYVTVYVRHGAVDGLPVFVESHVEPYA